MESRVTQDIAATTDGTRSSDVRRYGRVAILVVGDLVVFVIFVLAGRSSHQEAQSVAGVVRVAAPFVLAWFVAGAILGAFGRWGSAATTVPRWLLLRTALSWVVACPAALALRALGEGHGIPAAFAVISFLFNGVLLLAWRGFVARFAWRD